MSESLGWSRLWIGKLSISAKYDVESEPCETRWSRTFFGRLAISAMVALFVVSVTQVFEVYAWPSKATEIALTQFEDSPQAAATLQQASWLHRLIPAVGAGVVVFTMLALFSPGYANRMDRVGETLEEL